MAGSSDVGRGAEVRDALARCALACECRTGIPPGAARSRGSGAAGTEWLRWRLTNVGSASAWVAVAVMRLAAVL